jgi:hypothetical protein
VGCSCTTALVGILQCGGEKEKESVNNSLQIAPLFFFSSLKSQNKKKKNNTPGAQMPSSYTRRGLRAVLALPAAAALVLATLCVTPATATAAQPSLAEVLSGVLALPATAPGFARRSRVGFEASGAGCPGPDGSGACEIAPCCDYVATMCLDAVQAAVYLGTLRIVGMGGMRPCARGVNCFFPSLSNLMDVPVDSGACKCADFGEPVNV